VFPDSDLRLTVKLRPSHPFLAEYDRVLLLSGGSGVLEEIELFPDTGGYALVNVYRLPSGDFLVRAGGNHRYVVGMKARSVTPDLTTTPESRARPPDAEFVGAFDFDSSRTWRFIGPEQRSEREIGRLYMPE
jgi:hypothetical protein